MNITLRMDFDIYIDADFEEKEIIQSESLDKHYFKLLIKKEDGNSRVTGIKVYEKETDKLVQQINIDCQLWGLDNTSVGDYNFDGIDDFSVFEASYAGPNTSRIYILRVPGSEEYFVSNISGVSLEFDHSTGLIYEHNQCCAGRSHMNATYKLVNNQMVLIEKKCLEYDDEKEEFIEKDCN
jgi:hypothetical protein